jgi:hypothetical protein
MGVLDFWPSLFPWRKRKLKLVGDLRSARALDSGDGAALPFVAVAGLALRGVSGSRALEALRLWEAMVLKY